MTKDQGLYNKPSAAVHPGALAARTLPQYNTISRVHAVALNSGRFDCFAVFIFEALLCWWLVYFFSFLLLHHCGQVSPVFGLYHLSHFSCLVCKVTWNVLKTWTPSNVTVYFSDSQILKWNKRRREIFCKGPMSNPLPFPHIMYHSCMWYCQCVICSLGLFTKVKLDCCLYTPHVT